MIFSLPVALMNCSDISYRRVAVSSFFFDIISCFWNLTVRLDDINAAIKKNAMSATSLGFMMANVWTGTVKK